MTLVQIPQTIASGNSDDPTRDMANWNALANVINGQLGDVNFNENDPLKVAKVAQADGSAFYVAPTSWSPTVYKADGSTALTATVNLARYLQVGKLVTLWLNVSSAGDPSGSSIRLTLPVTAVATKEYIFPVCYTVSGATTYQGVPVIASGVGSQLRVYIDSTNLASAWGAANNAFELSITYEAA